MNRFGSCFSYGGHMIRQATKKDIAGLEALYQKRVQYNDAHDIHQWNSEDVTWAALSNIYRISDFYVIETQGKIVAAVCFVNYDPAYWPEMKQGESYYLHKICVDPDHAKQGYSEELITYFKERGKALGYKDVRLDVRAHKEKLRAMYEKHGFVLVREEALFDGYHTALYRYVF